MINYDELPVANKKVYDLVVKYAEGNVSKFAKKLALSSKSLIGYLKRMEGMGNILQCLPILKMDY